MNETSVRPKAFRPKRSTLLSLGAGAAALVLVLRLQTPSERLTEFQRRGNDTPVGVVGEEVFFRHGNGDPRSMEIRAMPLRGGTDRLVFRSGNALTMSGVSNSMSGLSDFQTVTVTREAIFFRTLEERSRPEPGPAPPVRMSLPRAPETHTTWERRPRAHLWRVPLSGGEPEEILTDRQAAWVTVAGDYFYWLESSLVGPGKPLRTLIGVRPKQQLFAAPLSGGKPRLIAVLPQGARIMAGQQGISWVSGVSQQEDLVYTRPPNFSLNVIPDFYGQEAPRELGGRLYWLDGKQEIPQTSPRRLHQLVSTAIDGSDRRVDLDGDAAESSSQSNFVGLMDNGSVLLAIRYRTVTPEGTETPTVEQTFCLIRPHPEPPRGHPRQPIPVPLIKWEQESSPGILGLNDGYVYYVTNERRENWWDWSAKGLEPRPVMQLYRVRIPK